MIYIFSGLELVRFQPRRSLFCCFEYKDPDAWKIILSGKKSSNCFIDPLSNWFKIYTIQLTVI